MDLKLVAGKRVRLLLVSLVTIYFLVGSFRTNRKLLAQFNEGRIVKLPTTSHLSGINLKSIGSYDGNIHDLRQQMTFQFPYDKDSPIPDKIWQTWKDDSISDLPEDFIHYRSSWTDGSFQYTLITDDQMLPFLELAYAGTPLIIEAFKLMPTAILKVDFFRYLVLYARGGIYSDMDTVLLKPVNSWPSVNPAFLSKIKSSRNIISYKTKTGISKPEIKTQPGFVIGIEADPDREDWQTWYARRIQFCQWTIQSKPGHPILRELILNITTTTLNSVYSSHLKEYNDLIDVTNINDYNVNYRATKRLDKKINHNAFKTKSNTDGSDVMNWTGPGIFTDIIFEYLSNLIQHNNDILLLNDNLFPDNEETENIEKSTRKFYNAISESLNYANVISWEFFSLMTKPIIIDDIMVLPITSFSPAIEQMEAKNEFDEMAFVHHMFEGTWKEEADKNSVKDDNEKS